MTIWELIALAKSVGNIDASLFKFKGSVFTTDDLPDEAENGDVYHVDADGVEYVWVEDYWESLGATIDLSAYRTAAAQDVIDDAQNTQISQNTSDISDLKSALKSGDEEDAIYHLGFYLDENGDLCQVESN